MAKFDRTWSKPARIRQKSAQFMSNPTRLWLNSAQVADVNPMLFEFGPDAVENDPKLLDHIRSKSPQSSPSSTELGVRLKSGRCLARFAEPVPKLAQACPSSLKIPPPPLESNALPCGRHQEGSIWRSQRLLRTHQAAPTTTRPRIRPSKLASPSRERASSPTLLTDPTRTGPGDHMAESGAMAANCDTIAEVRPDSAEVCPYATVREQISARVGPDSPNVARCGPISTQHGPTSTKVGRPKVWPGIERVWTMFGHVVAEVGQIRPNTRPSWGARSRKFGPEVDIMGARRMCCGKPRRRN